MNYYLRVLFLAAIALCAPVTAEAACTGQFSPGQVCANNTGALAIPGPTSNLVLGKSGTTGSLDMVGGSSGSVHIVPQAAAGTPTITWPTTAGTVVTNAASPVAINATTGAVSCPTCLTGSGGALTATSPLSIVGNNIEFIQIDSGNLIANSSAGSAAPVSTTLTALIDRVIGSTQGMVLYRGASSWSALSPSTSGYPLLTGGAAANPSYAILGLAAGGLAASMASAPVGSVPNFPGSGGAATATAAPTLGASGTLGSLTFGNATSGLLTIQPTTGVLGTNTLYLPVPTTSPDTFALLGKAQIFTALQTITPATVTSALVINGPNNLTTDGGTAAITFNKGTVGSSLVDMISADNSGKVLRIFVPADLTQGPGISSQYFSTGGYNTRLAIVGSGHSVGSGNSFVINKATYGLSVSTHSQATMLSLWSDILGPTANMRLNQDSADERYIDFISGTNGYYHLSIRQFGELAWGGPTNSDYDGQDTFFARGNTARLLQVGGVDTGSASAQTLSAASISEPFSDNTGFLYSKVLYFAAGVPVGVAPGQSVADVTNPGGIEAATLVDSVDTIAKTVTLDEFAHALIGDTIRFNGSLDGTLTYLSGATIIGYGGLSRRLEVGQLVTDVENPTAIPGGTTISALGTPALPGGQSAVVLSAVIDGALFNTAPGGHDTVEFANLNTAAADFIIAAPRGTGSGLPGNIVFKGAPAGGSGTSQNAYAALATFNTNTLAVSFDGTVKIGAGTALTSSGPGGALASAAFVSTGTSGATVPLLNGTNTASGVNTFSNATAATSSTAAAVVVTGGIATGAASVFGGNVSMAGTTPSNAAFTVVYSSGFFQMWNAARIGWVAGTDSTAALDTYFVRGGASGKVTLAGTTPMLALGATTSSFAAIKNATGPIIAVRLGDDSADAGFSAGAATLSASTTYTAAAAGPVLKQGANGRVGTFICTSGGTITITNSSVAVTDAIIISLNTVGGTILTNPTVNTITASTGFTALCATGDTSTYNYAIIKNAAWLLDPANDNKPMWLNVAA